MSKNWIYEDLLKDYEDRFKKKFYASSPYTIKFETNPTDKVVRILSDGTTLIYFI